MATSMKQENRAIGSDAAENKQTPPVVRCGRVMQAGRPMLAFLCQHCERVHFHDPQRLDTGPTPARCHLPSSPYFRTGYFLEETK